MVADTTKYVLLAANNSLQLVVHVHEKNIFKKLCSKYEKNTNNEAFPVTFDSHAEHREKYDGYARSLFLRCLQV